MFTGGTIWFWPMAILVQILSPRVDILPDGDLNGLAAGDHVVLEVRDVCCKLFSMLCVTGSHIGVPQKREPPIWLPFKTTQKKGTLKKRHPNSIATMFVPFIRSLLRHGGPGLAVSQAASGSLLQALRLQDGFLAIRAGRVQTFQAGLSRSIY